MMSQGHHCKPDAHTYSTLIDACSRAERPDMALKVYARAMASKVLNGRPKHKIKPYHCLRLCCTSAALSKEFLVCLHI